jgi:hypothetical protein
MVRTVNESGQAAVPVTVHGTTLTGTLIAQSRYFSELVEENPLMSALEPGACWARGTPRRRRLSPTTACTCGQPVSAATPKPARARGASA